MAGNNTYSTFIDTNYVDSSKTELVFPPQKSKYDLYFLESMKVTYTNEENEGSSHYSVIWTAAMFAQTLELPLFCR